MSGICGIVNFDGSPVDPEVLRKMTEAVAYRGPDGIHYWIEGNVGLAHLALHSTPEALRERQPLVNRRGDLVLTADARVDNRQELISTLTAKGYLEDKNPTDADLILAAYDCWGETCPEHIIGDFAFAIWDKKEQTFFCACDALSVNPLHYSQVDATVCIASEAQQLLQHPAVPNQLDEVAIAYYLTGCIDEEHFSFFQYAQRLRPANILIATPSSFRVGRYWDIDPKHQIRYKRDEEYAEHFLTLFKQAVTDRLRTQAGVIGILMSGGLDSCSVAAVAHRELTQRNQAPRLAAHSFIFDRLKSCDERTYMQAMASELGVEVTYVEAERFELWPDPEKSPPSLESPFLAWEPVEYYVLARLQTLGAKVILTGHGGDNLLAGSSRTFLDQLLNGQMSVLLTMYRLAREEWKVPYWQPFYKCIIRPWIPDGIVRHLHHWVSKDRQQDGVPSWLEPSFVQRTQLADRLRTGSEMYPPLPSYAQRDIYANVVADSVIINSVYHHNRHAASSGLEARHPFLDRRLAEFVLAIPGTQLYHAGQRKWILRQTLQGILPEVIRCRKDKARLGPFVVQALREKHVEAFAILLRASVLAKLGIVKGDELLTTYQNYINTPPESKTTVQLRDCISMEMWLQHNQATLLGVL